MKIGIASDHAGYETKQILIEYLKELNYEVLDYGTNNLDSVDYPLYAFKVCDGVINKQIDFGILVCYTGIGMSMASNKRKGIRCAKVDNVNEAKLARLHNNSNILALSALKDIELLKKITKVYLETQFSNDSRHIRRINMLEEN